MTASPPLFALLTRMRCLAQLETPKEIGFAEPHGRVELCQTSLANYKSIAMILWYLEILLDITNLKKSLKVVFTVHLVPFNRVETNPWSKQICETITFLTM